MKLTDYLRAHSAEGAQQAKNAAALNILGVAEENAVSQAPAIRAAMDVAVTHITDDDDRIRVAALYPAWTAGEHVVGDIYTTEEPSQVWECFAAYDNGIYPDITPGSAAWATFNRPLHGKSRESAMPYVAPTNALDIYHAGEWMVLDGVYWRCKRDSSFGPGEDPTGWEAEA